VNQCQETLHARWRQDLVGIDQRAAESTSEEAQMLDVPSSSQPTGLENECGGLWVVSNVKRAKTIPNQQIQQEAQDDDDDDDDEEEEEEEDNNEVPRVRHVYSVRLLYPGAVWPGAGVSSLELPISKLLDDRWQFDMLCCRMHGLDWARRTEKVIWEPMAETKWLHVQSVSRCRLSVCLVYLVVCLFVCLSMNDS
jgi:hypothetical protein